MVAMTTRALFITISLTSASALKLGTAPISACRQLQVAGRSSSPTCSDMGQTAEDIPLLTQHPRRKVALLVEPTPFTHVSGYSNRFKEMLRYLKEGGDLTEVITPDDSHDRPADFLGVPIKYVPGFRFPLYKQVQLTFDIGLDGLRELQRFKPDLIHAVTPGFFVMPAIVYSRVLNVPLVISYHTHLPAYAARYVTIPGLREACVWGCEKILPLVLNWADLTLTTSPQLKDELAELGCTNLDVWRKGIDTNVFNPAFNESNIEMRNRLSGGEPHSPLLLYVGRLGAEKNIALIKHTLEAIPEARLAVVGAGPAEEDLRAHFEGTNTVFMGLMQGEELSRAYAAADVFVMPSESETLGFVVLESMASKVPAVCAAAGGLVNLVKSGETGFLFEPGNAEQMTEQVRSLISDGALRERMGKAGREETLNWDWKAATSVLRNRQYSTANERFKRRQKETSNVVDLDALASMFRRSDMTVISMGGNTTMA